MTFTPIPKGTDPWDQPVNDAFTDQDTRITANATDLGNITDWQPNDNMILSWTLDPAVASGSVATTSGSMALGMIAVKKSTVATTLYAGQTATTTTATAGYMGVYDASGNLIGQTADQSATWNAGNGPRTIPLVSPIGLSAGKYYIALLINAASTGTWLRGAGGTSNWCNLPISGAQRFGNFGTGLTTLPTSFSPGAVTSSPNSFTFGVA